MAHKQSHKILYQNRDMMRSEDKQIMQANLNYVKTSKQIT